MDLQKQITELQEKANKYDNIRGRNVEFAKRLSAIIEQLNNLVEELDPAQDIGNRKYSKSGIDIKTMILELYDRALHGTHITGDLIMSAYPELSVSQKNYIITQLKLKPKIKNVKEGWHIRLYVEKEI